MASFNAPKVDGDLFFLPEPMDENDNLTAIYFYINGSRHLSFAELNESGLFLHWNGMRIPFDPNWNIRPVFGHPEHETVQ